MRLGPRAAAVGAALALGALLVTLTVPGGSEARWQESETSAVTGPTSDVFSLTATDVPDQRPLSWPDGRMRTQPTIELLNDSRRNSSWVDVRSTRVTKVLPGDGNDLIARMALTYTYGSGSCGTGQQADYWRARGVGAIMDGAVYQREQQKVSGATLDPGATQVLCPVVRLDQETDSTAGQRRALLDHAGRAVDIRTVVAQRSEAPATWSSPERTVTSRVRIAAPAPVTPAGSDVCRRTFSNGNPSSIGYFGGFFWGWPDAATNDPTATPAMAGGWEILRRTRAGGWEVWKSESSGDVRRSSGHNSRDISDVRDEVREFKLRGYPFAGDRSRYVESAWIARAHNDWSLLTDRWACDSPRPNPDAGPHNMP